MTVFALAPGDVVHAEGGVLRQIVRVDRVQAEHDPGRARITWRPYPDSESAVQTHLVPVNTDYETYVPSSVTAAAGQTF